MNDLAIHLTDENGKHLYEQIYEYIADEIREGKLLAGEKLPSTRSLADYLQVARSTVELAYDQLASEGYIESVPYRGYYICRVEELYRIGTSGGGLRSEKKGAGQEDGQPGQKDSRTARYFDIDFSPNAIDMNLFPFGTWRKITRDILSGDRKELFALGEPRGDLELRKTVCRYLHASRGVNASPEQIIVGAGNDYLLLLLQYILGRGITAAFENPSYRRAFRIFSSFAARMVTVPSDENGIRVDGLLASGANVAYVMPSRQFPTGTVMPIGRRTELLRWASSAEDRYLVEDDYDSEFRYRGKPIPSLQSADTAGRVIYIGTFSKSVAPAIRISFMVLPERLMEAYEKNCSFFSSTVSRIDQTILNEFILSGAFERHLNRMRKAYREKHDLLLDCLQPLLNRYRLSGEYAGLHVLLTSRVPAGEEELLERAAACGVRIYGLKEAALAPFETDYATVLLGYGGLDQERIREGIRRLDAAL
ncbi:MAG TPA: PLP-dependent aminotransferase family protein [Candidatus Eisenbergiella intestinigallinarum]|uniref:PLP-dependent aminotransferase family protein n=2 Tax=Eisenbergiella TaxID=1432051 RepID=A0A9D2KYR9_9FIRM|nr:PLP-dependent aminotransferase family protein [Candidatus Eisenbergiella merdipullorum]HJC87036.1 PLP-dependent aminotransferase family protein [Candidatus Eisenbergiella intestinigallinarum]